MANCSKSAFQSIFILGSKFFKRRSLTVSVFGISRRYAGHVNSKYKMNSCFTTDDAYVVSGSETNGQIFFWDLVEVRSPLFFILWCFPMLTCSWIFTFKQSFCAHMDLPADSALFAHSFLCTIAACQGKVAHTLQGQTGVITCVAYHPTDVCVLASSTDGSVRVWKNQRD